MKRKQRSPSSAPPRKKRKRVVKAPSADHWKRNDERRRLFNENLYLKKLLHHYKHKYRKEKENNYFLKENCKMKEKERKQQVIESITKEMKPYTIALLKNEIKNGKRAPQARRFDQTIKDLAIQLNFYSPACYNHLRNVALTLPANRMIRNYLAPVECGPGHLVGVLKHIQETYPNKKRCTLVVDGMSIHKGVFYDPQFKTFFGMCSPLDPNDDPSQELATECLMFFLVSLDGKWRFPVGYWLTNHLIGFDAGNLVNETLSLTFEHDIHVRAVVFDGYKANITMANSLGKSI